MCRLPVEGPKVPVSRPVAPSQRPQQFDDEFLQYTYKVVPCDKTWRHDYATCPFAHAGESSERRHPATYLPFMCNSTQHSTDLKEKCPFGTSCKYAHGHFELWLHPGRFRTKMCSLGENCRRPVCFFAHSDQELRVTPYSKLDTSATLAAQQLSELQSGNAAASSSGRSSSDGSDIKTAAPSTTISSPCGSEASHPLLECSHGSPCSSEACDDTFAAYTAAMALNNRAAMLDCCGMQLQNRYLAADVQAAGLADAAMTAAAPSLWLANSNAMLQQPAPLLPMQPAYGSLLPQQQQLAMDNALTAGMLTGFACPTSAGMPGNDLVSSWVMAQNAAAPCGNQWPTNSLLGAQQRSQLPYAVSSGLAAHTPAQMHCLPVPNMLQPTTLDQWLQPDVTCPPGLGCGQAAAAQPAADPRVVQLLSALPDTAVQQLLGMLTVDQAA